MRKKSTKSPAKKKTAAPKGNGKAKSDKPKRAAALPLPAHRFDPCVRQEAQLDKTDLLIVDELGYLSFSRGGAELLFQVFADRYERTSLLITSNLAFSEWGQVFQGERMTAALLDRLTHRCHIFEMNAESYRFRESVKAKTETTKGSAAKKDK